MVIFLTIGFVVALLPVHAKYVREFAAFGHVVIYNPTNAAFSQIHNIIQQGYCPKINY